MSEQIESQSSAPHEPIELSGESQVEDQQQNQHGAQRGGRNGKGGQQRGGRYGSSKYNHGNNGNQYNRYNGNNMGGSGRNYHNNGYKPHRGNMNAAAAAAAAMQWPGYYNPQMYYMPPQMPGAPSGPTGEMSPSSSPVSSASGTPAPAIKKIEITTKTGEHLDLNAIHHTHHGANHSSDPKISSNPAAEEVEKPEAEVPAVAIKESTEKSEVKSSGENSISEAEKTKREFLEQIKLRKAALEKKKHEQIEASKPKPVEPEPKKEEPVAAEKPVENDVAKEEVKAEEAAKAEATEKPVTTFAEKLKLKKEAERLSAEAEAGKKVEVEALKEEAKAEEPEAPKEETEGSKEEAEAEEVEAEAPKAEAEASKEEFEATEAAEDDSVDNKEDSEQLQEEQPQSIDAEATEPEVAGREGPKPEETEPEAEPKVQNEGETEEVNEETSAETDNKDKMTVTQLMNLVNSAKPIEDIFAFQYPSDVEAPDARYKKSHIKYTYGPTFLLQFKDKIKTVADDEWVQKAAAKIVIPPGTNKSGRPRDPSLFAGRGGGDFRKSGSMRGMEGRSGSRNSSKRKSKRMMDDRRSNRSYTSRRDRERDREEDERKEEKPSEPVAPLVPSANRWVPKSRTKVTEKKLAPDGVTEMLDKETAERKMKSLLNKLTLEMFDPISADILKIANQSKWETQGETLKIVIEEVFHKACDEPHWSSMYAQLCGKLVKDLDPEIKDEENEGKTGPKLVLHYLVARCHAEFEKGWTDKLPTKEDGSPLEPEMMSDEYYKAAAAKRRGLGLVRLIGFLYRLNLLTGKMMFECFRRLMKDLSNAPSEETLESVVELLSTVGQQFETDSFSAGQATLEGSALLDSLFAILQNIIETAPISNRMKFKLIDIKELREEKHWNSNKKEDGPKTIQQIHEEEERQRAMKNNNSRSNSRRMNSSMGSRNSFRREAPTVSKDNFISTRSSSQRHAQKPATKEENLKPQKSSINMFSALMDDNDDDE